MRAQKVEFGNISITIIQQCVFCWRVVTRDTMWVNQRSHRSDFDRTSNTLC